MRGILAACLLADAGPATAESAEHPAGNGWVAAAMAEVLRSLPPGHPRFDMIDESYRRMMEALLRYQSDNGMWRQVVDCHRTNDPSAGPHHFLSGQSRV
jgi:rhamnogalacturonyl hydrolase YesR